MTTPPELHTRALAHEARAEEAAPGDAEPLLGAAHAWLLAGQPERAQAHIEEARHRAATPTQQAEVHAALGALNLALSRPGSAATHAQQAIAGLDPTTTAYADAACTLARAWALTDRYDAAEAMLADLRKTHPVSDAALHLAELRVGSGDVQVARDLQRLIKTATRDGDVLRHGRALTALGRWFVDRRDYPRGRAAHEAALPLHVRSGFRAGTAASLGGLGLCRLGQRAPAEAVQRLIRAIQTCMEIGDLSGEAAWRTYLDECLVILDRAEWRARELVRFIEVTRHLGDDAWTASLCSALGTTFLDLRDAEKATTWLQSALSISRARGDVHAQGIDEANLGIAALLAGDATKASRQLAQARALIPEGHPAIDTLVTTLARVTEPTDAPRA